MILFTYETKVEIYVMGWQCGIPMFSLGHKGEFERELAPGKDKR